MVKSTPNAPLIWSSINPGAMRSPWQSTIASACVSSSNQQCNRTECGVVCESIRQAMTSRQTEINTQKVLMIALCADTVSCMNRPLLLFEQQQTRPKLYKPSFSRPRTAAWGPESSRLRSTGPLAQICRQEAASNSQTASRASRASEAFEVNIADASALLAHRSLLSRLHPYPPMLIHITGQHGIAPSAAVSTRAAH